jgi:5-(carboxyamino)imidazole ribonucleotide mutase
MGSVSDLPIMRQAAEILDLFSVTNEIKIVSAHRTVDRMLNYARTCKDRGMQVIIAGAGGAAHLPGMIATLTTIPVIGVPIKTGSVCGLDSLLSIVQMPFGVPVATVAINGSKNAALLACQILGISSSKLSHKIQKYRKEMEISVLKNADKVEVSK